MTMHRERVERVIKGRRRTVLGRVLYVIHKRPPILLQSISSTVEEIDSQYLSNPPLAASSGESAREIASGRARESYHQKHLATDDGFRSSTSQSSKKAKAKTILLSKGLDSQLVDVALARVSDLAGAIKVVPGSPAYYVASVERALVDRYEYSQIEAILRERQECGITSDAPLDPTEKHAASKIVMLHAVVEEAARLGCSASELMAQRLAPNLKDGDI